MDGTELLLINGQDKTDNVASFHFVGDTCEVTYCGSGKVYRYRHDHVQNLKLQNTIDPSEQIVHVNGVTISDVSQIQDFGTHYRIICKEKKPICCRREEVELLNNCLSEPGSKKLFNYFQQTAAAVSLVAENGHNILDAQYRHIQRVGEDTVLATYLNPKQKPKVYPLPDTVIYPFGLNQSQKQAVENALSNQISIIQGPPGTGKTQTILNIISNAVKNGKTVAVVSNNNSATLNVAEKLEKKGLSFLTAFLGSKENKEKFLISQSGKYPNMESWHLDMEKMQQLQQEIKDLSKELTERLSDKNRIAAIEQELLELEPEQHYFLEYYATYGKMLEFKIDGLNSKKILALWLEYEQHAETESKVGIIKKIFILFRFGINGLKLFLKEPEVVIPYLQRQFYIARKKELSEERDELEKRLQNYSFDEKMDELTEKSLCLFYGELNRRFHWQNDRKKFEMRDFRHCATTFNKEYPVILSTTYSIKSTLDAGYIYDYLIIDEASQVDLATGVLAFSCARNIVIVGDTQQLPNVLDQENIKISEKIWSQYALPEMYHFSTHSLLSSALEVWKEEAPSTLLREHYRCHPKIINFCNQKFYGGKLIVMTTDHQEQNVLTMYKTRSGSHARGHLNQRQIDVIKEEALPRLQKSGYENIGIITPYRQQVSAIAGQLGNRIEVATVHKFQGREKDAIILTSVDNVITDFVDDPRMLNVAVSRAVKSLTVITSNDPANDRTNYGDLARYIEYNNCEVLESKVYSVFDLLYKEYARERMEFLQKHKKVSDYDSENLLYAVIEEVLGKEEFCFVDCAVHVELRNILKDYTSLSPEEEYYAKNPLTHVDFLLFRRMDKSPLLAIEVDGTMFHTSGKQVERDQKKNVIFEKYGIPLLRLRTDGSNEESRVEEALRGAIDAPCTDLPV